MLSFAVPSITPPSSRSVSFLSPTSVFAVLVLVLSSHVSVAVRASMGMPGGPKPVENASNDLGIQELAQYAVEQHNSKQSASLKLLKVVSASTQVVAGTATKLKIWAAKGDGSSVAEYDAKVWEKPWEKFKELSSFDVVEGSERALSGEEANHLKEGKLLTDASAASGTESFESVSSEDPSVKQAAEQAVAQINKRSNSMVPFELKGVKAAHVQRDGSNSGSTLFRVDMELSRGTKTETKTAHVEMSGDGNWVVR